MASVGWPRIGTPLPGTMSVMVLPSAGFDADGTLAALQSERCTVLHGVPTMFIAELDAPGFADVDLLAMRAGRPLPPTPADRRFREFMTETENGVE